MALDNLVFAVAVAAAFWVLLRHIQRVKAARRTAAQAASAAGGPPRTMPRIGTPGTVTAEQIAHLKRNNFEPSTDWSREEATLILTALAYARLALTDVTGRRKHAIEVQNRVLAFLLSDEALRRHMIEWGNANATARRPEDVALVPNEHLDRVAAFIRGRSGSGAA